MRRRDVLLAGVGIAAGGLVAARRLAAPMWHFVDGDISWCTKLERDILYCFVLLHERGVDESHDECPKGFEFTCLYEDGTPGGGGFIAPELSNAAASLANRGLLCPHEDQTTFEWMKGRTLYRIAPKGIAASRSYETDPNLTAIKAAMLRAYPS